MMIDDNSEPIWFTSDFPTICVLKALHFDPDCIDRTSSNRVKFGYCKTDDLTKIVSEIRKKQIQLEPLCLFEAQREIKAIIYNDFNPWTINP